MWSRSSLPLSLSLPQIKISVIKLIKVMPICLVVPDLISYATQLWGAVEVLPLMWHSLLLKIIGFSLPLSLTHTFYPCSIWACSVNRPLAKQHWWRVPVPSGGLQAAFGSRGPRLCLKHGFEQSRQSVVGRHFNAGQGSCCTLERRLPMSGSAETCGSSGEAFRGSAPLPPYRLG